MLRTMQGTGEREALRERFRAIRARTVELCAPLETEDHVLQCAPEASPPKWHLAHVTWFFESFVLAQFSRGYERFAPAYDVLFNSYYETVGTFHPRVERGHLSRPTVREVLAYREHVDRRMTDLLAQAPDATIAALAGRVELGLHHEQQHQELLLMDIKRNFFANPLRPSYGAPAPPPARAPELRWTGRAGGVQEIGHGGEGFAFDNELPRHRVLVRDHALASRLVTNGDFLQFIDAGGYDDSRLWLSDGIAVARARGWRAPLYWERRDGAWTQMTLRGMVPLEPDEPVCHVSYYEADAYARFVGARLPDEAELEVAAAVAPLEGNFAESGYFHPVAPTNALDHQLLGNLWEWTGSPYLAYPGFKAFPGSLGEYNGKFMCNQFVLRGGSAVTPRSHLRVTYRNFFHPEDRWAYSGIRLARDG